MFDKLVDAIFNIDPLIRYVAIVDKTGERLEGGIRREKMSLNPPEEEPRMFMQTAISRGMVDSWSKYFSNYNFSIISYKNVILLLFPFQENNLLVTMEPSASLDDAGKILDLAQEHAR